MSEPSGAPSRASNRRLAVHVLALSVVLLAVFALVDVEQSFSADEGVAIVQSELLVEGTWTMPHPAPELDPEGEWFPLDGSIMTDEGFAPYVKHPAYPLLLVPFASIAGQAGMVLASVAATVLAAWSGALLVRRWDARLDVVALWVLGIASPLFFNGYLVIAHTLAAACCGFGVLLLFRALDDPARTVLPLVGGVLLFGAAVLLRSEAILLVGGLAVAIALVDESARVRRLVVASALIVTGLAAYLVDARANQWVLGSDGIEPFTIDQASEGFVASRLSGFVISWILPVIELDSALGAALILAVGAVGLALGVAIRRRSDPQLVLVLAVTTVGLSLVRMVVAPSAVVPGLLPAFPLLCVALPVLWPDRDLRHGRSIVVGSALFALAVLATQYSSAGSSQWGGRYLAIALVLVVPLGTVQLDRCTRDLVDDRRILVGSALVVSTLLAITAVLGLRTYHGRVAEAEVALVAAIESAGGDPLVVATRPSVPRLAHDILDQGRWLLVDDEDLGVAFGRFGDAGEEAVLVVVDRDEVDAIAQLPGYEVVDDVPLSDSGETRIVRLGAS